MNIRLQFRLNLQLLLPLFLSLCSFGAGFTYTPSSSTISVLSRSDHVLLYMATKRLPFITGNWKLNPSTKDEAIQLAKDIVSHVNKNTKSNAGGGEVALFVPFPFIESVQETVGDRILVGAEMVTPENKGAFTGAISPMMLKSIGVQWVLAGHSERRTINKETDEYINAQCQKLIENGMNVILCIGESLSEFEKNLAGPICAIQLKKGLAGITADQLIQHVCIAYEPVWAIGTGKVATPEIAQDVHATCRMILSDMYGKEVADQIRILYGGSVGPESVDGLMAKPDIDGCLVGGASLSGDKFGRIINYIVSEEKADPLLTAQTASQQLVEVVPGKVPVRVGRIGRFTDSIKRIFRSTS